MFSVCGGANPKREGTYLPGKGRGLFINARRTVKRIEEREAFRGDFHSSKEDALRWRENLSEERPPFIAGGRRHT